MQPLVAVGSLEGGERCGIDGSEPALEAIGDEAGGTAGDVDVLATRSLLTLAMRSSKLRSRSSKVPFDLVAK